VHYSLMFRDTYMNYLPSKMIAIDLDDTIADFMGLFVERYGMPPGGLNITLRKMYPHLDIDSIVNDPEFYRDLQPIDGAVEVLCKLAPFNTTIYLSARDFSLQAVTERWLRYWGFPSAPVVCAGMEGKIVILQQTDIVSILLDDMELFLRAVPTTTRVIAYTQPWNIGLAVPRINSWRDFDERGIHLPKV